MVEYMYSLLRLIIENGKIQNDKSKDIYLFLMKLPAYIAYVHE